MKFYYLIFFFLFITLNIYCGKLLDKEIITDAENGKTKIEKQYIYNDKNNLIEIRDFRNNKLESTSIYNYISDRLESSEEYLNGTKKMIRSKFEYDESNRLIKKIDFKTNNEMIMYHEYLYDGNYLVQINDYLPDKTYIGKKVFKYSNKRLLEELLFDINDNRIIIKKYNYKNNLIDTVDYYSYNGEKLRRSKRIYSNISANTSIFGLRDNFYDLK
jgi:antitoxin component YwqK of YwqJK toxin-antitoxin module